MIFVELGVIATDLRSNLLEFAIHERVLEYEYGVLAKENAIHVEEPGLSDSSLRILLHLLSIDHDIL